MTEQNPEQSQDFNKAFREIMDSSEGVPIIASLVNFDELRGALYDRLSEISSQVDEIIANKEKAVVDLEGIAKNLAEVIKRKFEAGENIEDAIDTAFAVIMQDNNERIAMMNNLLAGESTMVNFKPEDLKAIIETCFRDADTISEAIEKIEQIYHVDLADDVEQFTRVLFENRLNKVSNESEFEQQEIEIKKDVKGHVVDVAKIAIGVSIAFAVNKLINRNI